MHLKINVLSDEQKPERIYYQQTCTTGNVKGSCSGRNWYQMGSGAYTKIWTPLENCSNKGKYKNISLILYHSKYNWLSKAKTVANFCGFIA